MKNFAIFGIHLAILLLAGTFTFTWMTVVPLDSISVVFAQGEENNNNATAGNTNATNSIPDGSIGLTNFDIPSIDITLPDGSSISPDFRSIYFNSGGKGDTIYAYYNDYGIPEVKPQLKASDKFNVDAYPLNANTPRQSSIQVSFSKIISGDETGNFTAMKLDKPVSATFNGNEWSVPHTEPGNYILNVFVNYPFGGIVQVYTIEIQVAA